MRVLYAQPYVPEYRRRLFDELAARLEDGGDSLVVASGTPSGQQALRRDTARGRWQVELPSRSLATPLGEFKYRSGLRPLLRAADACVMELDVGNLNAWLALTDRDRPPLVLWGHGKSYTTPGRRLPERLKVLMARRADHVMTYSPSGREHLLARGLAPESVTAVGNSTDTRALRRALAERRTRPLDRAESFGGLPVRGRTVAMFVGGLDGDKRIPFLVEAARAAHRLDPRFLLLVAGSGADAGLVRQAAEEGCLAWIPTADHDALADLAAVSRALWMPGRVGLVAVDAMALEVPVFSTDFPYHAPEFEFLTAGVNLHVLPDDPLGYARQALLAMQAPDTPAGAIEATGSPGCSTPPGPFETTGSIMAGGTSGPVEHLPSLSSVVDRMLVALRAACREHSGRRPRKVASRWP